MIEPGMHGGGGGWGTGLVILAVGIVFLVGIYLLFRRSHQRRFGALPVPIKGLGYLRYNPNEYDKSQVERIGIRFREIQDYAWDGMAEIYGEYPGRGLNYITLHSEYEHIIKLRTGPGNLTLRPQGGQDHPMEYWFALEMHNLFRCRAFGNPLIYLPRYASSVQRKEWRRAQQVCIDAAECER